MSESLQTERDIKLSVSNDKSSKPASNSRKAPTRSAKRSRVMASAVIAAASAGAVGGAALNPSQRGHAKPTKPHGLQQIQSTFGAPCSSTAQASSMSWPNAGWGPGTSEPAGATRTRKHHSLVHMQMYWAADSIAGGAGWNRMIYGFGAYTCKLKSGSSTNYSTHAWGIAVDTNTVRNPIGQSHWDGVGADNVDYKNQIPDIWQMSWVDYTWGLSWNDPHHFQYATGY